MIYNFNNYYRHPHFWDIAERYATQQGDVSPMGSKDVAWHQMENMGNLGNPGCPKGGCHIKPINVKILQIAFMESDQFVVLLKLQRQEVTSQIASTAAPSI